MTTLAGFPEALKKNEGTDGKKFLFWLQQATGKGGKQKKLMIADSHGYSEAPEGTKINADEQIPLYGALFGEHSCILMKDN